MLERHLPVLSEMIEKEQNIICYIILTYDERLLFNQSIKSKNRALAEKKLARKGKLKKRDKLKPAACNYLQSLGIQIVLNITGSVSFRI